MVSEKIFKMFKLATIFFCLAFVLASCKNKKDNNNDTPPPLYPQPKTIALNTNDGYSISPVTGDSIKPIVNSLGGIVKTGEAIQATGKIINMDSVATPKKKFIKNPHSVPFVTNIFNLTSQPRTINVEEDKLKNFIIGKDTSSFVFLNSTGDTVQTGTPIRAKGKIVPCLQPVPVAALPLRSKDGAIFDIRYLDVDQGLSSSNIFSIIEDTFGNLWFATYGGGVCRYDGESFVHYTEKEGLSNNSVLDMTLDKNSNLWFGTEGNGICRYDGKKFIRYTEKEGLNNNFVRKIVADKKGNLWIGTEHGGVSCFHPDENGEAGTFIHYNKKEGLTDKGVFSIAEDKYGDIWLGTRNGGMCRLNMTEAGKAESMTIFTEKEGFCSRGIWDIKEDSNGDLWFGTNGEGLCRYVSKAKRSGGHLTKFTTKEGLSDNSVWTIMQDHQDNLWLGTLGGGADKYQPGKNSNPGSFTHFTDKEGLSNNEVWALKEDKHGNIWIGTFGAGVNRLNTHGFVHYTKKQGLCDNKVWAIKEDKQHNLWLGTWGDGLNKLIPGDNGGRLFFYGEQNGLPENSIVSIVQDKKGNFWFANWRSGATYFEPEKNGNGGTFTVYSEKEGLPKYQVYAMLEDKKGNIWISTWGGGVVRFDGKTFIHYTEEQGLGNNIVYCIAEDAQGNIWFGTEGGGVSRFHPADDGKTGIFTNFTEKEGLCFNTVFSILEDKKGNIWIGTEGGGVSCFKQSADGKNDSFTNYSVKEGLSNNVVNSILQDRQGNLWMGTDKGLDHFVFENGNTKIYNYNNDDGLKAMDFTPQSAILDHNNQAWWGTGKSLVKLDLNNYQSGNYPINVLLKELDINGKHIDYRNDKDSMGYKISFKEVQPFYNYPVNPVLPFFCNYLTFHFAAADMAYPGKIKYSYKLKGFSNEWSPLSHESKAEFRNLKHGDYVFMVRAIGQSQQWSNAVSYPFTIRPPWWLTWWARCFYVLAALALLRWYILYRSRLLKKENTLLEKKVSLRTNQLQRQTAELEESLNNLKSTQDQLIQSEKMASLGELTAGIAHEIQNPLNFVNNFAELNKELLQELKEEADKGNIAEVKSIADDVIDNEEKINYHGKRADAIVKGMLQHSRNSKGIKEPTDINTLCDEYLRLSYHGLRAKDKSFNATIKTDFDTSIGKINIIPQEIGRVILNLLNNAFYVVDEKKKQQPNEYDPTVSIQTKKINNKVEIRVTDNGNGIPQKVLDKIFQPFFTTKPTGQGTGLGLSLSYDIIKAHSGEIKVESEEGKGTSFTIQLPE